MFDFDSGRINADSQSFAQKLDKKTGAQASRLQTSLISGVEKFN
jgi:hypothetical protein